MIFKIRNLNKHIIDKAGRNNSGKITVRHRNSGVNRAVELVNSYRHFFGLEGLLIGFSFDSIKNRNCPLNIVYLKNFGILINLLSFNNSNLWDKIYFINNNINNNIFEGSNYTLEQLPLNTKIFNVEISESLGGQVARAAGTYCRILKRYIVSINKSIIQLELPSKIITYVSGQCIATVGIADNILARYRKFSKAGSKRILGYRPRVRGVAMNPVDHPHGGGEGKTSGGRSAVSAWGILTKGKKTVKKKSSNLKKILKILKKVND